MFRIYSFYVQEDSQKPEAHSIPFLSLFVCFFSSLLFITSPPLQAPGQLFWCPESHSLPWNSSNCLIAEAQIKSKGPDGMRMLLSETILQHFFNAAAQSVDLKPIISTLQIFTECLQGTRYCRRPFGYIDKQSSQTSCPWGSNTVKRDTDDESKTINKHECMLGGRNCPPLFSFPKQFWLFGIIIIPTSSFPLTLLTWAVFSHWRGSEWVLKGKQALGFSGCSDWISPLGGKKCEEPKRSLQRGRWQRKSYRSITAKFNLIFTLQVTSLLLFVWRPYNQVD